MSTSLKLTAGKYDTMVARGAFDDLIQKIELINGEIQAMDPAGPVHDDLVEFLTQWSVRNTDPERIRVRIQSGPNLPEFNSRPEPDIAWVKARRYLDRHPVSTDVELLIEVSYSSLKSDQQDKEALYAQAGIIEYWIIDIEHELIHVHRDPEDGQFTSIVTISSNESITPLAQPDAILFPSSLFDLDSQVLGTDDNV